MNTEFISTQNAYCVQYQIVIFPNRSQMDHVSSYLQDYFVYGDLSTTMKKLQHQSNHHTQPIVTQDY